MKSEYVLRVIFCTCVTDSVHDAYLSLEDLLTEYLV